MCGHKFGNCLDLFACWRWRKNIDVNSQSPPPVHDINLTNNDSNVINSVDLCIQENGIQHHTSSYFHMKQGAQSHLVVRRGQPFKITITLNKPYDQNEDLTFMFSCSDKTKPNFEYGTLVMVSLTNQNDSIYSWKATLEDVQENVIIAEITPSPNCIVAKWDLAIQHNCKNNNCEAFHVDKSVYIIFNPWCPEDQVFMESDEWREEAVLNTDGLIWQSPPPNRGLYWKYAQFDEDIMDCALYLIETVGKMKPNLRNDPVHIVRILSAVMNVQDDNGVLVGNWSKKITGGTHPMEWTGSRDILQQYYKTRKPVKYGQCWVFAGILTTVCRSIGIPCRTVTNFNSGHDENGSIIIDFIVNDKGEIDDKHTIGESIWNFHVWSEAWMKRRDLGEAYDGWQAIDGTPQEQSNGIFRCGPTSVAAIKNGDVHLPYDANFVFSEVNADVVYWSFEPNTNTYQCHGSNERSIGQNISTKAPGFFERLDVTDTYKFREDSKDERAIFFKAMNNIENFFGKKYIMNKFKDFKCNFDYKDDITIGEDFDISLLVSNITEKRTVNVLLRLDLYSYTGKLLNHIKENKETKQLNENSTNKFKLDIRYDDYKNSIIENCVFVMSCLVNVENTDFSFYDRDDFRIRKPDVQIKIEGTQNVGMELSGKLLLKNPLPVALKKAKFIVDAPGFNKQLTIDVKKNILPGEVVTQDVQFTPREPGRHTLAAKFISNHLKDVDGFLEFVVKE